MIIYIIIILIIIIVLYYYTNIINEENTNIINEENTNIINEENTNIINEENTNIINEENTNIFNEENSINNYICLFAYYEKNDETKKNLEFFLDNAILNNIDYYIIINGNCTVNIPKYNNIKIIKRENKGFDFGAWSYAVKKFIIKNYDYYIFINSSIRGPYLDDTTKWLDKFLELFVDDVKLVGTSINIFSNNINNYSPPYTHVQSMFFILNNEAFNFLLDKKFFDDEEQLNNMSNLMDIVLFKEITMSQLILQNNWNINCILSKYKNYDYRILKTNINPSGEDPYFIGTYFYDTIKPEDVIFFKMNRY